MHLGVPTLGDPLGTGNLGPTIPLEFGVPGLGCLNPPEGLVRLPGLPRGGTGCPALIAGLLGLFPPLWLKVCEIPFGADFLAVSPLANNVDLILSNGLESQTRQVQLPVSANLM